MTRDELERLGWDRLDGTLSAEDADRLDAHLASNTDAHEVVSELRAVHDLLSGVGDEDPPGELRPRIDRAVVSASPVWRSPSTAVPFVQPIRWRVQLATLAAGVVLGAVGVYLVRSPGPPQEARDAAGAIRSVERQEGAVADIDLGEDVGRLEIRRIGVRLALDLEVIAERGLRIVVKGARAPIQVGNDPPKVEVAAHPDQIELSNPGLGRHRVDAVIPDPTAALVVSVYDRDGLLVKRRVPGEEGAGGP